MIFFFTKIPHLKYIFFFLCVCACGGGVEGGGLE